MSTTPAGWYADPTGRSEHRYWDGNRWTEHVSSRGIPTTDPVDASGTPLDPTGSVSAPTPIPVATQPATTERRGLRSVPWWAWALGGAVILLVVGAVALVTPTDQGREITAGTTFATRATTTTLESTTSTSTTTPTTTSTTVPPTTTTTVAPPAPPPAAAVAPAPASSGCDPNYSGCVPIASDVDSAGGSGNGPAYTGPVQVIGSDIYDLDTDGDGYACER